MRYFVLFTMTVTLLLGCAEERRQEIIERHPGGEKMIVAVYTGTGTAEQLIERHTFDDRGQIVLKEDLVNGKKFDWFELHPELVTAEGMRRALQGTWHAKTDKEISEFYKIRFYNSTSLTFEGTNWSVISSYGTLSDMTSHSSSGTFSMSESGQLVFESGLYQKTGPTERTNTRPEWSFEYSVSFIGPTKFMLLQRMNYPGFVQSTWSADARFYRNELQAELDSQANGLIHDAEQTDRMADVARLLVGSSKLEAEFPEFHKIQLRFLGRAN